MEEKIPVYSMWTKFYETITALMNNIDNTAPISFKKVAEAISSSKEIFVLTYDSYTKIEEYEALSKEYYSFLVWILGRLFYLSISVKTQRFAECIVNTQITLLHQLLITQPGDYDRTIKEYSEALKQVNVYNAKKQKATLTLFVPPEHTLSIVLTPIDVEINSMKQCTALQLNLMNIIKHLFTEDFICSSLYSDSFRTNMESMVYLSLKGSNGVRIKAFEIVCSLFNDYDAMNKRYNFDLDDRIEQLVMIQEHLVYNFFGASFSTNTEFDIYDMLLSSLLDNIDADNRFIYCFKRITRFVLEQDRGSDRLFRSAAKVYEMITRDADEPFDLYVELGRKVTDKHVVVVVLPLIEIKIMKQIDDETFTGNVYESSSLWNEYHDYLTRPTNRFTNPLYNLMVIGKVLQMGTRLKHRAKHAFPQYPDIYLLDGRILLRTVAALMAKPEVKFDCRQLNDILLNVATVCLLTNDDFATIVEIISYPIRKKLTKSNTDPSVSVLCDRLKRLNSTDLSVEASLESLLRIMQYNAIFAERNLERQLYDTFSALSVDSEAIKLILIRCLPLLHYYLQHNYKNFLYTVTRSAVSSNGRAVVDRSLSDVLPTLVCLMHGRCVVRTTLDTWNDEPNRFAIRCLDCTADDETKTDRRRRRTDDEATVLTFSAVLQIKDVDVESCVVRLFSDRLLNDTIKVNLLDNLIVYLRHLKRLHTAEFTTNWLCYVQDSCKVVRKKFARIIYDVVNFIQKSEATSMEYKSDVLLVVVNKLREALKRSLQIRNYDLQETLLETNEKLSVLDNEKLILPSTLFLIHIIMIPMTCPKLQNLAIDSLMHVAKSQRTTPNLIYIQHKKDLLKTITDICVLNYKLFNLTLENSLENLTFALGFFGTKDLIANDCHHLLPFFVPYVVEEPRLSKLLDEIAATLGTSVDDLLINKYANIYPHILLHESEIFNRSMEYIDKTTNVNNVVLKKRLFNFQIILNELLLNFNSSRDRVIAGLKQLALDDPEQQNVDKLVEVSEYLQPRFLGVLVYFDSKLVSRTVADSVKKKVILSLSDIMGFMGSRYITPLRFKVLATLKTALGLTHSNFPALNCKAWGAFIHSCDIESIGPQLASVVVSLLTMLGEFPTEITAIFEYLIVNNEDTVRDNIADLFFVLEIPSAPEKVKRTVRKHLDHRNLTTFARKLEWYTKYLQHETEEVRIYGLQFTKRLLEENREDLDGMIMGYNGIDPLVVNLVDILASNCKENNPRLARACGECIGALGAIEPSHLPRRSTQTSGTFTFFIDEDNFVVGALNELIRAVQVEEHTTNVDRFSFAVQEILKHFDISPNSGASRHKLWKKFTESQKEIMIPLLSSRYTMAQPLDTITVTPIYQSALGGNYGSWIHNWTCKLISMLKDDKQNLLKNCFPSFKQDQKTLMMFLPYILLHSIVEGTSERVDEILQEFQAVIDSRNTRQEIDDSAFTHVAVRPSSYRKKVSYADSMDVKSCTKTVFILLDFVDRWLREWEWVNSSKRDDRHFRAVQTFFANFSKLDLALCNYDCGEYLRALVYLERHLAEHPDAQNEQLSLLSEIYALLNESDAVHGIAALQHAEPSLEQRILGYEVAGRLADAAACYEKLPLPLELRHMQGLIQCYIDLDNVNTALNFARGAIVLHPDYNKALLEAQAEPLWRLGRFDELDDLLKTPTLRGDDAGWGVLVGKALLNLKEVRTDAFNDVLGALRTQQVKAFGAISLEHGLYQDGYSYIAKLHALSELQEVQRVTQNVLNGVADVGTEINRLTTDWEFRLRIVQDSIRIIEPILSLRRVSLQQAKELLKDKVEGSAVLINRALGKLWLQSAKLARSAGIHQQAYTYTLCAEEYNPEKLFLEKAKLYWMRDEHEMAFTTLKRGVEKFVIAPSSTSSSTPPRWSQLSPEDRKLCGEAKLLIAKYNDVTSNVEAEVTLSYYKEAVEVLTECEKSLVCLAQYYDRVFSNYVDGEKDVRGSDMQVYMINYFGKSLQYGNEYVYQSMPRLLSIWFDYGTRSMEVTDSTLKKTRREALLKMTKLIDTFLERLPAFIFLTAFSQIVSRICHPQREVYLELKTIIIKLVQQFPQQTMWMMVSVLKSSYPVRSKRCLEILNDGRIKSSKTLTKFIVDFTCLAERLIELCNTPIADNVPQTTVARLAKALPKLLHDAKFSRIIMPAQKFRKLILPNSDLRTTNHDPFPNEYVYIVGIEDAVTVLPSLQRPRKISLRGSDGKKYIHMLKPKDDLRRDFRLMEFNDIVNQLLMRDGESRQRRLNIRTYSVAPLNEECGLIEWVNDLVGLRPILINIYKQKNCYVTTRELKSMICNNRDALDVKREAFLKKLIPKHPPVLGEWFQKTFPDIQGWLAARNAYTRTTAVISIVGYMLGLGDRHGENILFDSTNGDTVHVDFNCLFNKGELFDWPERVPFRLTHNMVAAMGPLGVEGVFRKSCIVTLKVLRTHTNTLMSIVTPFVYDPLVSWTRSHQGRGGDANTAEMTNEQAVEHVQNIKLRLQGIAHGRSKSFSIPLSVEGQTNNLIMEATSTDNLCRMYVGWGPFL